MKTDVIVVSSDGDKMEEALTLAEKVALYKGLPARAALQLRLLSEEALGMMRSITGNRKGKFWIEDMEDVYQLHLQVDTPMDMNKQEQLLSASTSGKNEAAKGFMGRIRAFFEPLNWSDAPVITNAEGMDPYVSWSMNSYKKAVEKELTQDHEGAAEAWDELEKSVISNIADEVKVSIKGRTVEMIIFKRF